MSIGRGGGVSWAKTGDVMVAPSPTASSRDMCPHHSPHTPRTIVSVDGVNGCERLNVPNSPPAAHAGTWTAGEVAVRLLGWDIRRGMTSPTPKHGQPPLGDGSVGPKPVMKADPYEGGGVATATLNDFPPRPIGLRGHIEQF